MAYKLPAAHNVVILWKKVNNITWEALEVILPFYSREAMKMFRVLESMTYKAKLRGVGGRSEIC